MKNFNKLMNKLPNVDYRFRPVTKQDELELERAEAYLAREKAKAKEGNIFKMKRLSKMVGAKISSICLYDENGDILEIKNVQHMDIGPDGRLRVFDKKKGNLTFVKSRGVYCHFSTKGEILEVYKFKGFNNLKLKEGTHQ